MLGHCGHQRRSEARGKCVRGGRGAVIVIVRLAIQSEAKKAPEVLGDGQPGMVWCRRPHVRRLAPATAPLPHRFVRMAGDPDDYFPFERWGVAVEFAPVPTTLVSVTRMGSQFQAGQTEVLVDMGEHGHMLIERDRVILEEGTRAHLGEIDFYLYGFVPRIIRILREQYSLHASAAVHGMGAVAVLGHSNAGKSTTTMGLVRRGHALVVDDVLPVDLSPEGVFVHGWERPLHLREEAAGRLGFGSAERRDQPSGVKVRTSAGAQESPIPLSLLIELVPDDAAEDVTLLWLAGAQRAAVVIAHSDVAYLASADGRQESFFRWAAEVADRVPVARISRPTRGWHLDEVLDAVDGAVAVVESAAPA